MAKLKIHSKNTTDVMVISEIPKYPNNQSATEPLIAKSNKERLGIPDATR